MMPAIVNVQHEYPARAQNPIGVLENPPAVKANTVPALASPISTGSILPGPVEAPKDK